MPRENSTDCNIFLASSSQLPPKHTHDTVPTKMNHRFVLLITIVIAGSLPAVVRTATPQGLRSMRTSSSSSSIGAANAAGAADAAAAAAAAQLRTKNGAITAPVKPATPVWPHRFGALLFQNRSSALAMTSLYYDWRRGRNLNLISPQLGSRGGEVWDLEHDNGTSFVFSRDPSKRLCKVLAFDVGILRPDWLANATLLGQEDADGFIVDVWTKSKFINYFDDPSAGRPVKWVFLGSGAELHVMAWRPGDALTEAHWQAPEWCFGAEACRVVVGGGGGNSGGSDSGGDSTACKAAAALDEFATGRLMRPPSAAARR